MINQICELFSECYALYSQKHYIFLSFYSIFHDLYRIGASEDNRNRFLYCYLCCQYRINIINNITNVPTHLLANIYLDMADNGFCYLGGKLDDVLQPDYIESIENSKPIKILPFAKENKRDIEIFQNTLKWETVQCNYNKAKELFIILFGKEHHVVKEIERKMTISSLNLQIRIAPKWNLSPLD